MAYTKTNWVNNSTPSINAENLNKIEQGIYSNDGNIETNTTNIGTMANLTTPVTSSLVGAINSVVESGSNTNGSWIKWADGTMICSMVIDYTFACNLTWGSIYYGVNTNTYTFPQTFTSITNIQQNIINTSSSSLFEINYTAPLITMSTYKNFAIARPISSDSVPSRIYLQITGRWKA